MTDRAVVQQLALAMMGKPCDFSGFSKDLLRTQIFKHKVYAHVDAAIQSGLANGIDDDTRQALRQNAKGFALLDLRHTSATQTLLEALHAEGLDALLIKGLPIAHTHYSAPYLRHRVDVDIYLREGSWNTAANLLSDKGYAVQGLNSNTVSSRQFTAAEPSAGNLATVFDVHKRISNRGVFMELLPFEDCWANRQAVANLGGQAWTMDMPRQLLLACMHRIAHGRNAEQQRLIWLFDVHLLVTSMSLKQQSEFVDLAVESRIGAVCEDALRGSARHFGTELSSQLLQRLAKHAAREPSAALLGAGKIAWLLADLKTMESSGQRLRLLTETAINQLRRPWA